MKASSELPPISRPFLKDNVCTAKNRFQNKTEGDTTYDAVSETLPRTLSEILSRLTSFGPGDLNVTFASLDITLGRGTNAGP